MRRTLAALAALVVVSTLCACQGSFNTAYGSGSFAPGVIAHKRTSTKRVEATATTPASEECECEGGICLPPPAPK